MKYWKSLRKLIRSLEPLGNSLGLKLSKGRRYDYLVGFLQRFMFVELRIDPFKLYSIDPQNVNADLEVQAESNLAGYNRFSPVIGGDWDKKVRDLGDEEIIYSFGEHFNNGKEWGETDFYSGAIKYLESGEGWGFRDEISEIQDLQDYLKRIDMLYKKIKKEGYRTQKDLFNENIELFWVPSDMAFERHEVTVNIGRKGEIILHDGYHRFSIAKALELDEIPVRIKVRHKKWQEIRMKALKGEVIKEYAEHPDIKAIIEDQ